MSPVPSIKELLIGADVIVRRNRRQLIVVLLLFGAIGWILPILLPTLAQPKTFLKSLLDLACGFLSMTMVYGLYRFVLLTVREGGARLGVLFSGFSRVMLKIDAVILLCVAILMGAMLTGMIACAIIEAIWKACAGANAASFPREIATAVLMLSALFGLMMLLLWPHVMSDNVQLGATKIIARSLKITKGSRGTFLCLGLLLFVPSLLVNLSIKSAISGLFPSLSRADSIHLGLVVSWPICAVFLWPHLYTAIALYYEAARKRYNEANATVAPQPPADSNPPTTPPAAQ